MGHLVSVMRQGLGINLQAMKKPILFLSLFFVLNSCVENDILTLEAGEFPLGSWTVSDWQENGFTLERADPLPENTMGYVFRRNGKLVNRTYSGWCATPPVVMADFDGKWRLQGEVLILEMRFWGGTIFEEWKILGSDPQSVTIERLKSEVEFDT